MVTSLFSCDTDKQESEAETEKERKKKGDGMRAKQTTRCNWKTVGLNSASFPQHMLSMSSHI